MHKHMPIHQGPVGAYTTLRQQVVASFWEQLRQDYPTCDALAITEIVSTLTDRIGNAIDAHVREYATTAPALLLGCVLEVPEFFTEQPDGWTCIARNGSPGQVTAIHCVYHAVYEDLRDIITLEFDQWAIEQHQEP